MTVLSLLLAAAQDPCIGFKGLCERDGDGEGVVERWNAFCWGVGVRLPLLSQGAPLFTFALHISFGLGGGVAGTGKASTCTSSEGRGAEDQGEGRSARAQDKATFCSSMAALEAAARSCDIVLGALRPERWA